MKKRGPNLDNAYQRLPGLSFSVAAGIFESVVSLLLLFTANRIAALLKKETLF